MLANLSAKNQRGTFFQLEQLQKKSHSTEETLKSSFVFPLRLQA